RLDLHSSREEFKETLALGMRLVLVLIIPATVGLFVLGTPIISLIFQHGEFTPFDTQQTAWALTGYLLGTPFAPRVEPTVWFFEDVNEKPYRIDRMLTQWSQAGLWRGTTAVLWGEMVGCTGPQTSWDVWEVISRHTEPLGVPVAGGVPSGHGRSVLTLPLGVRVRIADERLEFLDPCVLPAMAV
ncbi:MAG: hypothetical protein ONB06_09150, partial [candidate division KSB1 bacterium]|nr:hypothetical protein [candidate division KSB1 bacterium]